MAASLRQRAEAHFREREDLSQENIAGMSTEDIGTILHELRVHQIELEMQNEDLRAAQADADASRARYFDLYDLAPVGYVTVSEAGLILEANFTAATLLGVERGALVGRRLSVFIFEEGQTSYYRCLKKLLDTLQPQECDLRMVGPGGTAFFAHLKIAATRNENAEPVCRIALIDVTAHKRVEETLRESEERYAQLAEQSLTVAWEVDAQGLYTYVSRVSETVWGYRPDELVGRKHFYDMHPESVREASKASAFTVFARKQPFLNFVNALQTKDGRHVWVSTNGTPILNPEGTLLGYRGSDTDITERKSMEERLNESLVAANAANRAKSEFLNVMSHELRTPLNGVLGFAQLLSDTLLDSEQQSFTKTISSSGEHLLTIINDILDFASIDAGALAIQIAPLAVADLVKTAEDTVRKTAAEKGLELRCELAAGVPEQIAGDERRLRQILINLLGNAVKFTASGSVVLRVARSGQGAWASLRAVGSPKPEARPCEAQVSDAMPVSKRAGRPFSEESLEGGHSCPPHANRAATPTVRQENQRDSASWDGQLESLVQGHNRSEEKPCRTSEEAGPPTASGGSFLDFCVEDTGIGISSETLSRLFQPFVQADSKMNRPFGGTGLGLSISRRIAEAMGGAITVASTPGKGSAFTFRLPLEVPAGGTAAVPSHLFPGAGAASPSRPSAMTPARPDAPLVLVVDDDDVSGVVAVKMLQNLGCRAEFVADGSQAVEAFVPGKYSVILMDVAMPVMDGLAATRKIREIEAAGGLHAPIIAFTANVMPGDRERCLAAGMDGFLSKPFGKEELAAKLACVAQGK